MYKKPSSTCRSNKVVHYNTSKIVVKYTKHFFTNHFIPNVQKKKLIIKKDNSSIIKTFITKLEILDSNHVSLLNVLKIKIKKPFTFTLS